MQFLSYNIYIYSSKIIIDFTVQMYTALFCLAAVSVFFIDFAEYLPDFRRSRQATNQSGQGLLLRLSRHN
jgi:hypothetical protein